MGRPIKKRFFGSDNVNDGLTYSDAGGEGVLNYVVIAKGSAYSQGVTITTAASPIGGTRSTGTVTVTAANGAITTGTVSVTGTGYTTAPAVTIVRPANVALVATTYYGNVVTGGVNMLGVSTTTGLYVGQRANASVFGTVTIAAIFSGNSNVSLSSGIVTAGVSNTPALWYDAGTGGIVTANLVATTTTANTIQANAFLTTGTVGRQADIVSQRSSRRYRVTNSDGTEVCRLIPTYTGGPSVAQITAAGGPTAAGYMTLNASDASGNTYWVSALDSRVAVVTPGGTGTPGSTFAANAKVRWTSTGTAASVSGVKIDTNN